MKRVKAACLEQTIHFRPKDELDYASSARAAREEFERFQRQLARTRTRYKIVDESTQSDGSLVVQIKRQYTNYNCGGYLS